MVPQVRDCVQQHGIILLGDMANDLALVIHRPLLTFQGAAHQLHVKVIACRVEGVRGLLMKLEVGLQVLVYRPAACDMTPVDSRAARNASSQGLLRFFMCDGSS